MPSGRDSLRRNRVAPRTASILLQERAASQQASDKKSSPAVCAKESELLNNELVLALHDHLQDTLAKVHLFP